MPDVNQKINIIARFIDKVSAPMRRVNTIMGDHNKKTMQNTKALGGFNFAWLSVMFAGMALYRVFGGILKQQMELWGLMEGFAAMLMVVMAPVMEWLSELLWPLLEWFMELPEPIQKVIGFMILFAAAFSLLLMVGGMFMLFLNSALALGLGVFLALGAIIIGFSLIVTGIIQIIGGKWEGFGLIIMGIGVILFLVIGWWALIPIAVGAAIYLIIKYWDKIKEFIILTLKIIWGFIKKYWWTNPLFMIIRFVGFIIEKWDTIKSYFKRFFSWWKDLFRRTINKIKGYFGPLFNKIKWLIDKIKWVKEKASGIMGRVLGSRQSGGIIPTTGPYMLHKGEYVVPAHKSKNQGGDLTINANYVVNVSDKAEMEKSLRDHNLKLVEEVKRQINV